MTTRDILCDISFIKGLKLTMFASSDSFSFIHVLSQEEASSAFLGYLLVRGCFVLEYPS